MRCLRQAWKHNPARYGDEALYGGQSENPGESRSEPVGAGLAPPDELETDEVPDSLISEFASLTTA